MNNLAEKLLKSCSEALFPTRFTCEMCGVEIFNGKNLCPQCTESITLNNKTTCPVCGRKTVRPELCLECKAQTPKYSKAVSPVVYENGAIKLIAKFKNGNGYLKHYFAELMQEKLKELPVPDFIVCVPATRKTVKGRGYNQSELLAKALSERTGIPYVEKALKKIKETPQQKGLSRKERAKNLEKCYKVETRDLINGNKILVVDDVLTTGATADEICKTLLASGAAKVYYVTVASVEYKTVITENK